MHTSRGITLIELIVTTSLVALLALLATPAFSNLRSNAERAAAVNGLFHAMFLARSESIKRTAVVTVCKSRDGAACAPAAAWHDGWIVFVNTDRDEPAVRDAGEPLLTRHDGWVQGRITSNRNAYSFRPSTQRVINGTVVFCDSRGSAQARAIIISHTGRPRISHRDASGKPLRCAGE